MDRLAVVRALIALKSPIAKPQTVGVMPDGTGIGEWDQHDSLVNYLLLTCFDVLGQQSPFVTFKTWLQATKLAPERQEAISTIDRNLSPEQVSEALYDWYNVRYSVTRGFFRFVDEVIGEEAKVALLSSIAIAKVPAVEDETKLIKLKKQFLFDLRNDFTHGAFTSTTVPRLVDGSRLEIAEVNGVTHTVRRALQLARGRIDQSGGYFVAGWPFVLYETVAGAIGEPVPDFDVEHSIVMTSTGGQTTTIGGVPRTEYTNPMKRAQILAAVDAAMDRARSGFADEEWVPPVADDRDDQT